MDNQRFFLFIALSLVILLLWQAWEREQAPPVVPNPAAVTRDVPQTPPPPAGANSPGTPANETLESAGRIQITTDLLRAQIDTLGGDLRTLYLLKYPVRVEEPGTPFQLLNDNGAELFITQSGLIGNDDSYPNHKSLYSAEHHEYRLGDGQEQLQVRLDWSKGGLRVAKIYTFHRHSYVVDLDYVIENRANKPRNPYLYAQFLRSHHAETSYFSGAISYVGGAVYSPEKKYQKVTLTEMAQKHRQENVTDGWVAMLQHYFVAAWLPPEKSPTQVYTDAQETTRYVLGYKNLTPAHINPGAVGRLNTRLYLGPKDQDQLEKIAPGLVLTVDYGWLTVIAAPLYWVLERIHQAIGNWGWAIVILTVLIKLAFYPLSATSYKSMANMRRLQPRLMSLKERYGEDRQRMHQATMELYKTEKLNPLGGCLPIVVQIPVFIALYWVLLESVELRQAPFALWIRDLSTPDPYFVLPIVMGITMAAQQMLNPSPLDPIQKKVMMALPFVFTVFFLFFPAGLVLYWVVNNALSIAQQWWITRTIESQAKPS
ncbi:MAG TPA: membrane protein insertase YidC [Acidiferrobacterales bacterium]|nr:membrane protein insertase YidC [Acidiferrobacterales bacterium]